MDRPLLGPQLAPLPGPPPAVLQDPARTPNLRVLHEVLLNTVRRAPGRKSSSSGGTLQDRCCRLEVGGAS